MSELKPCPFCGSTNCKPVSNGHNSLFIECMFCGASGPTYESDDDTAESWNRRTQPAQAEAVPQDVARDAKRYRWLRDNWFTMSAEYDVVTGIKFTTGHVRWSTLTEAKLDATIDTHIAASPQPKGVEQMSEPRTELRKWERAVLAPPHPADFGIPREYWDYAENYAQYLHLNRQEAARAQPAQVPAPDEIVEESKKRYKLVTSQAAFQAGAIYANRYKQAEAVPQWKCCPPGKCAYRHQNRTANCPRENLPAAPQPKGEQSK